MNELDRHTGGQGGWITAVGNGVAACLLTVFILGITFSFSFRKS